MLAVIAYDDDDDAVRIANNSIYGLSGAVFGGQDRALRRRPPDPHRHNRASTAATTSTRTARSAAIKQSGVGREMGVAGLEEFLERKTFAAVVRGAG